MIAYDEMYLDDAMKNLGEAFDYVVNACKQDADAFMELFINGGIAASFGKGHPKYVAGMSGTELVMDVYRGAGIDFEFPDAQIEWECSPEYWSGWILAYYQWFSKRSFADIHSKVSVKEILRLYPTLHEASEEKFADVIDEIIMRRCVTSKLQLKRKLCGLTQRELAEKAEVNLRTLQEYELGRKDLSKASVQAVLAMAGVLGCRCEDILESY